MIYLDTVADHGPGVQSAHMEKLFLEFQKLASPTPGAKAELAELSHI